MKNYMDNSISASEERMKEFVGSSVAAVENRWLVFYESAIQPRFELLAEGHQTLLDTLSPKSRVDALEEEVLFLKSVVKTLAQDVTELKQAQ